MAIGVNLVTEVEKLNIAMKFVAPVIAFALLVVASSVGKPPGEKSLFYLRKSPLQLMCVEEETQMAREAEHAHSFFHYVMAECLY